METKVVTKVVTNYGLVAIAVVVGIILGGIGGYYISDGMPDVIDIQDIERVALEELNEYNLSTCERNYDRQIETLTEENIAKIKDMAAANQNIMDSCTEEIIPVIKDLSRAIFDLNQTVFDLNVDCNC